MGAGCGTMGTLPKGFSPICVGLNSTQSMRIASGLRGDMIQLTKRTEYGLIALVHLADKGGAFVSVREIADHYPVPKRLLAEVLKDLSRAELVESARGKDGGYALRRAPEHITLAHIVAALEGRPSVSSCESTHAPASAGPALVASGAQESSAPKSSACGLEPVCPIRSPLHRVRDGIWGLMERTTLRSLVEPSRLVPLSQQPTTTTAAARPTGT